MASTAVDWATMEWPNCLAADSLAPVACTVAAGLRNLASGEDNSDTLAAGNSRVMAYSPVVRHTVGFRTAAAVQERLNDREPGSDPIHAFARQPSPCTERPNEWLTPASADARRETTRGQNARSGWP